MPWGSFSFLPGPCFSMLSSTSFRPKDILAQDFCTTFSKSSIGDHLEGYTSVSTWIVNYHVMTNLVGHQLKWKYPPSTFKTEWFSVNLEWKSLHPWSYMRQFGKFNDLRVHPAFVSLGIGTRIVTANHGPIQTCSTADNVHAKVDSFNRCPLRQHQEVTRSPVVA